MLNILWPILIIISYMYAILSGNVEKINSAIFEYTEIAVNLCITLLGTMCLWNGIMEIAKNTFFVNRLTNILSPIVNFLFPKIKQDKKLKKEISMNIVANLLGLGNAATPLGIKAMKNMQEKNQDKNVLSDDMAIFLLLNTASIQIIPTTVIAIRISLGSLEPTKIIFAVWISTICSAFVAIILGKLLIKLRK